LHKDLWPAACSKAPLASDLLLSLLLGLKGAGSRAWALGIRQAPIIEVPGIDGHKPAHLGAHLLNRLRCGLTLVGRILPRMGSDVQSPRDLVHVVPDPAKLVTNAAQRLCLACIPLGPATQVNDGERSEPVGGCRAASFAEPVNDYETAEVLD